jgi:transposase
MRGKDEQQLDVFSYISREQRVPQDHPLRSPRAMADEALSDLQPRFNRLYAKTGRPSIAPEKLLRALLLQALYSVAQQANADGTARLQPALSLVRGLEHG